MSSCLRNMNIENKFRTIDAEKEGLELLKNLYTPVAGFWSTILCYFFLVLGSYYIY